MGVWCHSCPNNETLYGLAWQPLPRSREGWPPRPQEWCPIARAATLDVERSGVGSAYGSTFYRDIVYSRSPTASRASALLGETRRRPHGTVLDVHGRRYWFSRLLFGLGR